MRSIRLIAVSDEYDSALGLKIKGTPDFDGFMADRNGDTIAHDLLEHQNGLAWMGPVWDELEAMGGIWQVRGRHGDMITGNGMHSPQVNCASDVSRMFRDWIHEGKRLGPNGLRAGSRPHLYDDDFNDIIAIARDDIRKEHSDLWDDDDATDSDVDEYLGLALRRMRAGFRKAERRFGDRFCGHSMFGAIRDAVSRARPEYEGQEFILRYGKCDATLREVYDDSDY